MMDLPQMCGIVQSGQQELLTNIKGIIRFHYYKNRKASGCQKHNAKWMAIYNDFVVCYEKG